MSSGEAKPAIYLKRKVLCEKKKEGRGKIIKEKKDREIFIPPFLCKRGKRGSTRKGERGGKTRTFRERPFLYFGKGKGEKGRPDFPFRLKERRKRGRDIGLSYNYQRGRRGGGGIA